MESRKQHSWRVSDGWRQDTSNIVVLSMEEDGIALKGHIVSVRVSCGLPNLVYLTKPMLGELFLVILLPSSRRRNYINNITCHVASYIEA